MFGKILGPITHVFDTKVVRRAITVISKLTLVIVKYSRASTIPTVTLAPIP